MHGTRAERRLDDLVLVCVVHGATGPIFSEEPSDLVVGPNRDTGLGRAGEAAR